MVVIAFEIVLKRGGFLLRRFVWHILLLFSLVPQTTVALDLRIAPLRSGGDLACTALVSATKTTNDDSDLRFKVTTLDGTSLSVEPVLSGDMVSVEFVAGDYRTEFKQTVFTDTAALARWPVWQAMDVVPAFHLTARLQDDSYRSSRFEDLDPNDILDQLATQCGLVVDDPAGDAKLTTHSKLFLKALLRRWANRPMPPRDASFTAADRDLLVDYLRAQGLKPSRVFSGRVLDQITKANGIVLLPQLNAISSFSGGVAAFRKGRRWGLIAPDGQVISSPRFSDAKPPQDGLTPVLTRNGWTVLDANGAVVVDWTVPELGNCAQSWCGWPSGDRFGFINLATGRRLAARYDLIGQFIDGFAAVRRGDTWSIISDLGKPVRRLRGVDGVLSPRSGVARYITKGAKGVGFVTAQGENPFSTVYADARDFSGGLAAVQVEGKWGYVERRFGRMAIQPKFQGVGDFSFGVAPATEEGTSWGLIDKSGNWVVAPQFGAVGNLSENFAVVTDTEGKQALYSLRAKTTVGPWVDELSAVNEGMAAFRSGKSWGLLATARLPG